MDALRQLQSNPQHAGSQPKHIVCCVTNRTPHVDAQEIFGFGVSFVVNSHKSNKLEPRTPAEIICSGAFEGKRRVKSTQDVEIRYLLPLWVNQDHWPRAKIKLFDECLKIWQQHYQFCTVNPVPSLPVIATRVICRILTNMVADEKQAGVASAAKGETSDCFISGYFSILRLLKQLALEHHEIVVYANETWTNFVDNPHSRLKTTCFNIGDLLPLLCITSHGIDWDHVKKAYVDESNLRNVMWFVKRWRCALACDLTSMQVPQNASRTAGNNLNHCY